MKAALLLAPLALAGCMVGPDYHRPPAIVPAAYKPQEGWKPSEPQDGMNRGQWWLVYHDPLLNELEAQVDVSNQTLKADYAAYVQSQAIVAEARASLFPVFGGSGVVSRSANGPGSLGVDIRRSGAASSGLSAAQQTSYFTQYTLQGNASWTPDVWGQVRRTIESDASGAQASAADLANARLSIQAALATAYFNLRAEDSFYDLFNETAKQYDAALQITENEFRGGTTPESNVAAARALLQEVQAEAIAVGVSRAQYEDAIAVLIGRPPAELSIAHAPLTNDVPVMPPSLPSTLLERRPDIAASERQMEQESALIGAAIATFYPTIPLAASGGYAGNPLYSLISTANQFWAISATASQTLFSGGLRRAEVIAARAAFDQSIANYREVVLTAFQEVEDDLAALRILEQEKAVTAAAVQSADLATKLTLNEFVGGTVIYTAVITQQEIQLSDEVTDLTVQQSRLVSSVGLIQALGGGWSTAELPSKDDLQKGLGYIPFANPL